MESLIEALINQGNAISVVTVILGGGSAFIWALSTDRLVTGKRAKEMEKTIETQATALSESQKELHKIERDFDKLSILYEIAKERGAWQHDTEPTSKERP